MYSQQVTCSFQQPWAKCRRIDVTQPGQHYMIFWRKAEHRQALVVGQFCKTSWAISAFERSLAYGWPANIPTAFARNSGHALE